MRGEESCFAGICLSWKFCAVVAVINQSELAMADYDSAKVPISLVQTCT